MYWILAYCAFSWLVGCGLWAWSNRCGDDGSDATVMGASALCWHLIRVVGLLLMPVVLPVMVVWVAWRFTMCIRNQVRIMGIARSYREPSFRAVDSRELETEVVQELDAATTQFLQLGFRPLGDFQTKSDPIPVYNRYLSGFGGAIIGDITAMFGECGAGLMSVLEDGTYVETAAAEPYSLPGEVSPADYLSVDMAGQIPVADLLDVHLAALERETKSRKTRILEFRDDQLQDVSIFGQRRFWTWRHRCGDATGEVPAPVVPPGTAVDIDAIRAASHAV